MAVSRSPTEAARHGRCRACRLHATDEASHVPLRTGRNEVEGLAVDVKALKHDDVLTKDMAGQTVDLVEIRRR